MIKFKYLHRAIKFDLENTSSVEDYLNKHGEDGWELVTCETRWSAQSYRSMEYNFIFKKIVTED